MVRLYAWRRPSQHKLIDVSRDICFNEKKIGQHAFVDITI
jgi:hypothetical protein